MEDAVLAALGALEVDGSPLLATVKGRSAGERKATIAAIRRERPPVAYVMMTGRSQRASDVVAVPQLTLWLATKSERSDNDARRGGAGAAGMYSIAVQAAHALHELALPGDVPVQLAEEKPIIGGEGMLIWEQQYTLDTVPLPALPTFGDAVLGGSASRLHVEIGALERAVSRFSFPGIDGVFERCLGTRHRDIIWNGQLRADDAAALNSIESEIDAELRGGRARSVVDEWGRTFPDCVMQRFERKGWRHIDPLSGRVVQPVAITFTQLHSAS